jgi:predicted DNA binding CopG/RHH family protein
MKKLKSIPKFKSEKEEREFWKKVDSTDYVDYSNLEKWTFPNLKLTSKPITIRIPVSIIEKVKIRANKADMPYQTLIKQYIYKGLGINP